jgi:hypothetical protein
LGSTICDARERVLSQTRYPKQPQAGRCDGIYYHFRFRSAREHGGLDLDASGANTPREIGCLACALRDYAEDTGQRRTSIMRTIEEDIEWLLTRRARASPIAMRVVSLRRPTCQFHAVSLVRETAPHPASQTMPFLQQRMALSHCSFFVQNPTWSRSVFVQWPYFTERTDPPGPILSAIGGLYASSG